MNDAIENLAEHPAIASFINLLRREYDLTSLPEEVGSVLVVRPQNPPYRTVRYVSAFVDHLEKLLKKAGFKSTDPQDYGFEGHGFRVWIENVDVSDPEEADPIEVCFVEI